MADTGTQLPDSSAPMDISSMVSGSMTKAAGELADVKRAEIKETGKVNDALIAGMDRDQARINELGKHTGVEPGTLQPWDEQYESAKRQTDPIAAFGSFGSVFGILASAFTHAPMANALNASAAAINAIKEGNDKDYDRAYKAWQDNTHLALERHKIQHEQYTDAVEMLKTNMAVGQAKLRMLAAKFGDQKTLVMLENGMDKEIIDTMEARQKLAASLQENFYKTTIENAKLSQLFSLGYNPKEPTSEKSQAALKQFNRLYGENKSADQQFSQQWWSDHPQGTSDEFSKAYGEFRRNQYGRPLSGEQEAIRKFMEENPNATADDVSRFVGNLKQRQHSAPALTSDRQRAQDVNAEVEQFKKDNPQALPKEIADFRAKEERRLKTESAAVTGNRIDDLKGKINQVELAEGTIGHIEEMLKKHNAITGLGGKVTRPGEIVSNVFGDNETDRKQFERWVNELQEIAPRILLDTKGRPLSAEAGRINNIIAGLQLGDTTANTARAYYEFKKVLDQIKGNLRERAGTGDSAPAAKTEQPAGDWWKTSPVVH